MTFVTSPQTATVTPGHDHDTSSSTSGTFLGTTRSGPTSVSDPRPDKDGYDLLTSEKCWRDRYDFLETHGYILRNRYRPDWRKSWLGTNRHPDDCEDSIMSRNDAILDAIHSPTADPVCIKITSRETREVDIARFLSAPAKILNPFNHCVPVRDVLSDPVDPAQLLLVMPYLRPFNDPDFGVIGEVVEFVRQTLEGLSYIHSQNVAHRDCASANIMMDGRPLYPRGHHPASISLTLDGTSDAYPLSRMDHPVAYYYVDFGISSQFQDGEEPFVVGAKGRDKAPELSKQVPYNAFMVDIWMLGRVYEEDFLQKYLDLDFLQPLVSAMVVQQPERRVTSDAALHMFYNIRAQLSSSQVRWRLRGRDESPPVRVMFDTLDVAKQGLHQLNRLLR